LAALLLVALTGLPSESLETCERDYQKIGCFKEKRVQNHDLLVFDRLNVKWETIAAYLHHLACKCSAAVKAKNAEEIKAGRPMKYVGFSLHYYGECYGQTQAHFEALTGRAAGEKHHCIGDQKYNNCKASHNECTGTHEAEYVYRMQEKAPEDVDGGYGQWNEWIPCSATCGAGFTVRERTCTKPMPKGKGKDCSALGESTQSKACSVKPCPVNGEFTTWSTFGKCSKDCGGGVKRRTRTCTNPAPAHGGENCTGLLAEEEPCNKQACPVDGGWDNWSSYSMCSAVCGGGTEKRYRGCIKPKPANGGAECVGKYEESRKCNESPCPVDGGFSNWSAYSTCTKTCGSGTQSRSRSCTNPSPAHGGKNCDIFGATNEIRYCNTHACPVPISSEYSTTTCENKKLSINCGGSRTIIITHATYGRKNKSICRWGVDLFWSTNCHAGSSWNKVTGACQGKTSCSVDASNGVFGDPCFLTPKYLVVKYKCRG